MKPPQPQIGKFNLYLDIETGPAPNAADYAPHFEAPGNYKDPIKIAAYIEEAKEKWTERAALFPESGRVLMVGMAEDDAEPYTVWGEEKKVVTSALDMAWKFLSKGSRVYGYNIHGFDLPFLVKRAWILGIHVPKMFQYWRGKWSWHDAVIDLMLWWKMGEYRKSDDAPSSSMAAVLKALGLPGKEGNGKDFAALLRDDPEAAQKYLIRDVNATREIAQKVGAA